MKRLARFLLNAFPRPWLIKGSYLLKPILDLFLRGNRFTDPINNKSYRYFLPYGYQNPRPNALSPGTFSLERHRLLWCYLKENTTIFNHPMRLLHVAPEQAFYDRFKKLKNLDYVTTDLKSPLAQVKADLCNLPFKSNSFDFILCNHVFEHIPNDQMAMKELFRVLKPGGNMIAQVPMDQNADKTIEDLSITDPKERAKLYGQYDHVRLYGMDYFDRLEAAGFVANPIPYAKQLGADKCKQFGLVAHELLPVCQKPL